MSDIHDELEVLSGALPAGYIRTFPLARVVLTRLLQNIDLLKGKSIPAGNMQLEATLRDVQWAGAARAVLAPPKAAAFPDKEVDILVNSSFAVIIDISVSGDPTQVVSTITMDISDARSHMRASENLLLIEGADFDAKRKIERTPAADNILQNAGIDPTEAAYVEGHVGYGVVSQAVANILGERREIKFSDIFPVIDFGKNISLAIIDNGDALAILPSERVSIHSTSACRCTDGPDFEVERTTITNTAPANPGVNDEIGQISLGGPVADDKDPHTDFGHRPEGREGMAGLYIPKDFARSMTVEEMPAVKMVASDNGTIGYRAEATVGFSNFNISFDLNGGGILLDIDLDVSVSAYCDFELFKGLRLPIGWAIISPQVGSRAHLQMGFYPSIDNSGTVKLKSTLKKVHMGKYVAIVIGIGTALKLLGVTAWIGFLIDVVLSAILSNGLPVVLKKEISKYLGNKEWKLIEGLPMATTEQYWSAPYSVKPDSLLASFDYRG
ncbi:MULTISPECIES: hypothetical protein [Alphaproteobacteria]|uniref:hypothetical protein n=1 Tax=Alphaproteobacteria TaxID=28211 RepID=UPI003A922115